jgi:hypothetical protein
MHYSTSVGHFVAGTSVGMLYDFAMCAINCAYNFFRSAYKHYFCKFKIRIMNSSCLDVYTMYVLEKVFRLLVAFFEKF